MGKGGPESLVVDGVGVLQGAIQVKKQAQGLGRGHGLFHLVNKFITNAAGCANAWVNLPSAIIHIP